MYINNLADGTSLPRKGKVAFLEKNIPETVRIMTPTKFVENLVCVVDNSIFDAAVYAYNEQEMKHFQFSDDLRPKVWLIVPGAKELAV